MRILILDGNPNAHDEKIERYFNALSDLLLSNQHIVHQIRIADQAIRYCIGCWACWVKNPGECIFKDDSHYICREYINSDFVIFASPVIMGFTSAHLKKVQDKLIPLLHPYIEIVNGECHHRKRYPNYPKFGLLLENSDVIDKDDIQIITDMYNRFALNFRTELVFTRFNSDPIEEIVDAINHI